MLSLCTFSLLTTKHPEIISKSGYFAVGRDIEQSTCMNNQKILWGIIGCGNVTEKKSGPAFNKVENSRLVAVMRRDAAKAENYAQRHDVPKWYDDANELVNDPEINAVYIATPPAFHEEYVKQALK